MRKYSILSQPRYYDKTNNLKFVYASTSHSVTSLASLKRLIACRARKRKHTRDKKPIHRKHQAWRLRLDVKRSAAKQNQSLHTQQEKAAVVEVPIYRTPKNNHIC
jgi:hypothetical protein